jgi:hypothetical protein
MLLVESLESIDIFVLLVVEAGNIKPPVLTQAPGRFVVVGHANPRLNSLLTLALSHMR